ncbi:hypothetical protein MJD09_13215, partial [bacterium]|nr:hypothetical protein [bacterium]
LTHFLFAADELRSPLFGKAFCGLWIRKPMVLVALDKIEPGMELATPVENRQGRVLVNAGVVLTEGMQRALGNWGIREVQVVSHATTEAPSTPKISAPTTDLEDNAEQELRDLFRKTDLEDPIMKELFRLALQSAQQASKA